MSKSERFELRLDPETLTKIDEWRKEQSDLPSRSEAVRTLIEISLGKAEQAQLFHLARFNLLVAALNGSAGKHLTNAYIYAWCNGIYPACHDGGIGLHKPFADCFDAPRQMVVELEKHLFDCWRKKNVPTFYDLEDHLRGRGKWDRGNLISVCRYLYLDDCFDRDFWDKILEPMKHPVEAGGLTSEFSLDDVYLA
ncbi:hypothetical protein F7D13_10290 [Methylocystis rosea]|uniref:Ribbon-helix-helix protein, CopG family n=1 Tax=Methylocystis rosea TaxID=173366 RepID=A0ABX6EKA3_9HYPH|nr:ribbon-helix-helix domain-containing protein [Methylocystis rosea]QGM94386.1 hypothetical protein F7D13_10290 [Methylocystis rosea]